MFDSKEKKLFWFYYAPILFWMGVIFYFSSIPSLKTGAPIPMELFIRKTAHLGEYAILAILFARMFKKNKMDFFRIFLYSFFCVLLFSLSDEFHQLFVFGRFGRMVDVGIDSFGGIIGLLIFFKKYH